MSDSESEDHSSHSETGRPFQQGEQLNTTTQAQDLVHSSMNPSSFSAPSSPCLDTQSEGTKARTTKAEVVTSRESTTTESDSRRIEQDIDHDSDTLMNQDSGTQIHETTSDQGTSSSAEHNIPPLETIHEVTSSEAALSSGQHSARRLDGTSPSEHNIPYLDNRHEITSDHCQIHEVKSDQGTSSSPEQDIQSLDRRKHKMKSYQETSSSADQDISSLGRKHETKLPLTSTRTKQVEEMECGISSLKDKFNEPKRKLRAKEVIRVKSTGSQTSNEQEEKLQLKMSDLELTVSRLEEELRRSKEKIVEAQKSSKSMETYYQQQLLNMRKNNEDLNNKASALERKLQNKEEEIHVALVERDTLVKEMKARGTAHSSPVEVTSSSSQTSEIPSSPEAPTRTRGAEAVTEPNEHFTANSEAIEENSRSNGAAVAEKSGSRDTAVPKGLPAPPRQQMRDLTLGGTPEARYDSNYTKRSPGAATRGDNGVLQRKYREVPRGPKLSPSYNAQENGNGTNAEGSTSHESTATDSDSRRTEQASGPDSDTLTRHRDSENLNSEPADSEGAQSGGATAWVENQERSCEHYDRYCDVQFSCCDNRFWPCHRCHNGNSSCNTRKLRSRDIKKLKCGPDESDTLTRNQDSENLNSEGAHSEGAQSGGATAWVERENPEWSCEQVNHPFDCDKCGTIEQERYGIQETRQNLEGQSESEEPLNNNQHAPTAQEIEYQVFGNYIPETIDTQFEFIRQDVPGIIDSLSGNG